MNKDNKKSTEKSAYRKAVEASPFETLLSYESNVLVAGRRKWSTLGQVLLAYENAQKEMDRWLMIMVCSGGSLLLLWTITFGMTYCLLKNNAHQQLLIIFGLLVFMISASYFGSKKIGAKRSACQDIINESGEMLHDFHQCIWKFFPEHRGELDPFKLNKPVLEMILIDHARIVSMRELETQHARFDKKTPIEQVVLCAELEKKHRHYFDEMWVASGFFDVTNLTKDQLFARAGVQSFGTKVTV